MRAAVFGASGGIGAALVRALVADPIYDEVHAGSRGGRAGVEQGARPFTFDLADEGSIATAARRLGEGGPLDLAIIATGTLHRANGTGPEKSLSALEPEGLAELFAVNTIGPAMIVKHVAPLLPRGRRAVLAALSARVGSIADNRLGGWHSYRMSKAALNMMLRGTAIELRRTRPDAIVAALHPGTFDTPLSRPFQGGVPAERVLAPDKAAGRLLAVIDGLQPADSGGFFAWDGKPIAF